MAVPTEYALAKHQVSPVGMIAEVTSPASKTGEMQMRSGWKVPSLFGEYSMPSEKVPATGSSSFGSNVNSPLKKACPVPGGLGSSNVTVLFSSSAVTK